MKNNENEIEEILDYLSLCEASPAFSRVPIGIKSTKGIRRLNVLGINAIAKGDDRLISGRIVNPSDYKDFTSYGVMTSRSQRPETDDFGFWKIQKLDVRSIRGLRITSGYVVGLTAGTISKQGQLCGSKTIWQWDGRQWVQEENLSGWAIDIHEDHYATQWRFSSAMQLERQSRDIWSVEIGYEGMPTIEIDTDPQGAKTMFKLRDVPEGKQRREALRNWVTEHWRRKPVNEGSVKVIEHLRGKTQFKWNGMICNIHPSPVDIARANAARQVAA